MGPWKETFCLPKCRKSLPVPGMRNFTFLMGEKHFPCQEGLFPLGSLSNVHICADTIPSGPFPCVEGMFYLGRWCILLLWTDDIPSRRGFFPRSLRRIKDSEDKQKCVCGKFNKQPLAARLSSSEPPRVVLTGSRSHRCRQGQIRTVDGRGAAGGSRYD